MLSTASKLGDLDATLLLLRTALKRGAINEPYCSWHIDRLKEKSATNAAAALLYGRISEATGKEDQALDLYRRAYALSTSTSTDDAVTPPPPSTSPPTLQPPPDQQVSSQALTHAALLYAKHGHHTAATSLFQRAAHLHSSPLASFHLAQQADPGSSEQEEYLLKAASAGIPAAAGELGRLYVGRARGGKGAEAEVCRKRAKEWLLVAVAGEYDRDSSQSESESEGAWSMVLLGDLLAVEGKEGREQALGWYKRVEEVALDEKAVESARRSMEELEKGGSVPASSGKA
jgi:tetratricopeptide (TPR) repeat protein